MSATPKLLIGLIALMVIGFLGIHTNLLPKGFGDAKAAEAELRRHAQAAIVEIGWVELRIDGQKAYLKGTAPSRAEAEAARIAVLRAVGTGGLVGGGITKVDTRGIRLPDDRVGRLPVAAPFTFAAQHNGDGILHLSGFVPDETVRERLLETAVSLFPEGVVDDLQLARGMPGEAWPGAVAETMNTLILLDRGGLRVSNTRLELYGDRTAQVPAVPGPDLPAEYDLVLTITSATDTPGADDEDIDGYMAEMPAATRVP